MPGDPRQTWKYFAQAVIQEENPEKLTYLMQQLYRELKDNQEEPGLA
jgi:outer membrane PBP1 activator LpoA protein